MSKTFRLLFLVVALSAASLVSWVVYQKTGKVEAVSVAEASQELALIAVADRELRRGDKISPQDLRMVSYLKETLPKGHFTTHSGVVDRVVVNPISESEPVLESALAPTDLTRGGMAAFIKQNKRAMAVKVDEVIGVAGFLHPGHMVDVLVSIDDPGSSDKQVTKTVLENIPVLSVGTQDQEDENKKSKKVTVVTLEVDLEEGEKLALAVNKGRIQLALRNYADTDHILTKGITVPSLLKSYATSSIEPVKVKEKVSAAPRPRNPQYIIEVMNGNQVSKLTLNGN